MFAVFSLTRPMQVTGSSHFVPKIGGGLRLCTPHFSRNQCFLGRVNFHSSCARMIRHPDCVQEIKVSVQSIVFNQFKYERVVCVPNLFIRSVYRVSVGVTQSVANSFEYSVAVRPAYHIVHDLFSFFEGCTATQRLD